MKLLPCLILIATPFTLFANTNEEKHSHDFPQEIAMFHDTMAPLWHAVPGKQRVVDTCAKIEEMQSQAMAIKNSQILSDSLVSLSKTCDKDIKIFEDTFQHVHDAFHEVSDKAEK